jgi:hypothetical protein
MCLLFLSVTPSLTRKAKLPTFLLPQVRIPSKPESQNLFITWPGAQSSTNPLIPQPLPNLSNPPITLHHHLCFSLPPSETPIREKPTLRAKNPSLHPPSLSFSREPPEIRREKQGLEPILGFWLMAFFYLLHIARGSWARTGRMWVSVWRGGALGLEVGPT